jgi:hypothetical protein
MLLNVWIPQKYFGFKYDEFNPLKTKGILRKFQKVI